MRGVPTLVALFALAVGVAVPPATAAQQRSKTVATTRPCPGPSLGAGPYLAEGRVGYQAVRAKDGCGGGEDFGAYFERVSWAFRLITPGARSRTLARGTDSESFNGGNAGDSDSTTFSMSPNRLAISGRFSAEDQTGSSELDTLRTGPFGGPYSLVYNCEDGGAAYDQTADSVAFHDGCGKRQNAVVVRQFSSGTERSYRLRPAGRRPPAISVDRISLSESHVGFVTYLDGAQRLAIFPLAGGPPVVKALPSRGAVDLDVANGGAATVVLAGADGLCNGNLVVSVKPGSPAKRWKLPVCRVDRSARGLVAQTSSSKLGDGLSFLSDEGDLRTVFDLRGVELQGWDAEGDQLTYALRGCYGSTIHLGDLGAVPRGSRSAACPARIPSGRLRLAADKKRVTVPVLCPRGCVGSLKLRLKGRSLGSGTFGIARGRVTSSVRLHRRARSALRGRRTLSVVVTAQVDQRRAFGSASFSRRALIVKP